MLILEKVLNQHWKAAGIRESVMITEGADLGEVLDYENIHTVIAVGLQSCWDSENNWDWRIC